MNYDYHNHYARIFEYFLTDMFVNKQPLTSHSHTSGPPAAMHVIVQARFNGARSPTFPADRRPAIVESITYSCQS